MAAELPTLLEAYQSITANPDVEANSTETFWDLRSAIAACMLKTQPDLNAHELLTITDGPYILDNGLSLPTLAETVAATQRSQRITDRVIGQLDQVAEAVILSGSANWGRYFSLYDQDTQKSDIDIDVIISDTDAALAMGDQALEHQLRLFEQHVNQGTADMLMSKLIVDGIVVSLHYIPKQKLDSVVSYPYQTSTEPFALRAFRTELPDRPVQRYGPTYNFVHRPYHYDLAPAKVDGGFTTGQPFMMVGTESEFVMAMSLHKLIVLSEVHGRIQSDLRDSFGHIFAQLAARKANDATILKGQLSFTKLLAKVERMPKFLQAKIAAMDEL